MVHEGSSFIIIIIIIIIMSLFNEDNIFSNYTNLTYGPLKSENTYSTQLFTYIDNQDVWET